ncbi:hypothetical protein OJ997_13775 [Solirubrobacter phytolaccae]|uniref:Uncharacterized protein n=1 Tax=Solirubrobacter phytolaccae TaxID=1404360 RepID=A0A9X3SBG5_9ACTN|nr:hypothetical protein [Solirubrobacter phytolaccae]MDA0181370.1 hypothetical protein [Solirubrobacter phytolaccae]
MVGSRITDAALRPARASWAFALRTERDTRRRVIDGGGRVTLVCVDTALGSPYAHQAVTRIVDSALAEHVVARALDRLDEEHAAQQVADRLLAGGVVERLAERVLEGPELERIVEQALASPGAARMIARVVESDVVETATMGLVEDIVGRLRESRALWTLIDDIAQSPAVLDAIAQQSAGLADQVGDELRERSRNADERLERAAWRLFHRRPAGEGAPSTTGTA